MRCAVSVLICLTTCPDRDTARQIASDLVERRLAACVNLLPGVQSVYRWEGAVTQADECMLLIKTVDTQLAALTAHLTALHPYAVPEVLALPVTAGLPAYLAWVATEAGPVAGTDA